MSKNRTTKCCIATKKVREEFSVCLSASKKVCVYFNFFVQLNWIGSRRA